MDQDFLAKAQIAEAMKTASGREELAYVMLPPFKQGRDYRGHIRHVLLESILEPGEPMWYEKDPDLSAVSIAKRGFAPYETIEGVRVELEPIPITAWVRVPIEETAVRRYSILDREQVRARAEMAEREDSLGLTAIDTAGRTATGHNTVTTGTNGLTREKLSDIFYQVQQHDAPVANIIFSAAGTRDMRNWGREEFGPTDQDALRKVGFLGDIWGAAVRQSKKVADVIASGYTSWACVVAEPEFSGVFSVRIDLQQMDATDLEAMCYGWLFFEYINVCIIIPQGVAVGDFTGSVAVRAAGTTQYS
jgi:hypothetical protein